MFKVYDEVPSDEFMLAIDKFEKEIIKLNKIYWNRSYCELQYQYKEFIIWIEVELLNQVMECPKLLLSAYNNYSETISDVNICTWIYLKKSDDIYHVFSLERTDDLIKIGKGMKALEKEDFFEKDSKNVRIFK